MQKILLRRTVRDLKANLFRYLTLFLLIVLSMFIVISTVASAKSVITTVNQKAAKNHLEDGQFGLFLPLDPVAISEIEAMGITLEACFSLDLAMEDDSILRVMRNRKKINLLELEQGHQAAADREIVLERLYADAHGLSPGDTLSVSGTNYTITGIATSPDYDCCLQTMSAVSADGKAFGTAFVTPEAYAKLTSSKEIMRGEEYRYSYRLGRGAKAAQLQDYLAEIQIVPNQVKNPYFRQMVKDSSAGREEISEDVKRLSEGAEEIDDALKGLSDGSTDLNTGIQQVYAGLSALQQNNGSLTSGSKEILSALKKLESAVNKLSFSSSSIQKMRDVSARLLTGTQKLDTTLQRRSRQVTFANFESMAKSTLRDAGMNPSALSHDAQILLGTMESYLTDVSTYLTEAAKGSADLSKNFKAFDISMASLSKALKEFDADLKKLGNAVTHLRKEYERLDNSISAYADSVSQISDGFRQIAEGSQALTDTTKSLYENSSAFYSATKALQTKTNGLLNQYAPFEIHNLTDFVLGKDNPRIKGANNDVQVNINIGIMAGIVVLILITYVISVFVIHSIDRESTVIGALYALGAKRRQLMLHYTMLPVVLCLFGGILGTALGYSDFGIYLVADQSRTYFSIPAVEIAYSPYLLAYGLLLPPLIAFAVNQLVIRKRLNRSALSLLRKEQPVKKVNQVKLSGFGFMRAFQIRQFLREKRSCLAVLAGMFVSLLILILGLNCYALCHNVKVQNIQDTKYTYMYQYKYPDKTIPADGHGAYVEGLKKEVYGYNKEVSFIGIDETNPYFPVIKSQRKNEISISSSVAKKYGLSAGDKVLFSDEINERDFGFTVKEVVPYSVGLSCFMDLDSMRALFGQEDDYYNVVYANRELDIDAGRLYSVTTKDDIKKSAEIFMDIMAPLVTMLITVALMLFLIVMYQMMKVMVNRSAESIALMKIFGYRSREIRKLYLDGNFLLVAVGALAVIPIAKLLMDAVYPFFIANVACGIDMTWPPVLYGIVYISILLSYLMIRIVLMRRLRKLAPVDVLKNRE